MFEVGDLVDYHYSDLGYEFRGTGTITGIFDAGVNGIKYTISGILELSEDNLREHVVNEQDTPYLP